MIGIYKIQNKITGEIYIGQSKDIDKRMFEHIHHKLSPIDKAIHKYGIDNFTVEVLQECTAEELDELEDYYICKYQSHINGYNQIRGGQRKNDGESNPNSKLNEEIVYQIRELYNQHINKYEAYKILNIPLTKGSFDAVWEGKTWTNVHMDIYTPENLTYYKQGTSLGNNSTFAALTKEEVLEIRERYKNETAREIYEDYKDKCKYQTFQAILWGRSYRNIPIYIKSKDIWII